MELSSLQIWERLSEVAKNPPAGLQNGQAWKRDYNRLERESFPRVDKIAAIADFYGVSLDSLVYGSEKNHRKYSSLALKIAEAADRLNDEGKEVALTQVEGLIGHFPYEISASSKAT